MTTSRSAFTLIELLIVVAIIGILAAIAVPNFLNAQVRAKVANTQADQRSLATAIESYRLDNNMYPPTPNTAANQRFARLAKLTSPIPYMSSVPLDPFRQGVDYSNSGALFQPEDSAYPLWDPQYADTQRESGSVFNWLPQEKNRKGGWVLHGAGPDTDYEAAQGMPLHYYDSSNGVRSGGDIYRFGP
ncbi:MAG TPA: type II secretion system protein GspG [bacterium]|nr:prepilin-type N-terminal cleavage/methylation domain-containing protein [Candidatus Omnitrophota bacterium]HOJ59922.1 type II secretion system protein GspG [bacterium]HPO99490.1 type II secretion system protein GspG [bacterium]